MQVTSFNNLNATTAIDVKNLCSRKLFELLSVEEEGALSQQQQQSVEQELILRQHYQAALRKLRGAL